VDEFGHFRDKSETFRMFRTRRTSSTQRTAGGDGAGMQRGRTRADQAADVQEVRVDGLVGSYGLGRLSNAAGPLIVAAVYQGSGCRSVLYFIAGACLVGAVVLAVFGPRTRQARVAAKQAEPERATAS
jgi:hypothetical protein